MLIKTWERHFFKETLKMFFFISFCFYGLYILIDYASHSNSSYLHSNLSWGELANFYTREWILRADVLVPFALMIASIRTLCDLNLHHELIALRASGISLKRLLSPFLFLGLLFTFLIYLNTEWLVPQAMAKTRHMYNQKELLKKKKHKKFFVQHVELKDHSTLLFQTYDLDRLRFFDAYWVKNFDEIWRIHFLYPYETPPRGTKVDLLKRSPDGSLYKAASFQEHAFNEMEFNKKVLLDTLTPPKELALTALWKRLPKSMEIESGKQAEMTTTFFHKIVVPWLCFFAVLAPAPFCVRYGRTHPVFFIYSLSLFSLVAIYLALNAALILGGRQIVSPIAAIGFPFILFFGITLKNYAKAN